MFKVRDEYWDMWGIDSEADAYLTYSDIEWFAAEWETTVEELLKQIEIDE